MIYWVIASPSILTTLVILIINCNEMDLRGIIVLTASIIITIIIGIVNQIRLVERNVKLLEKRLEMFLTTIDKIGLMTDSKERGIIEDYKNKENSAEDTETEHDDYEPEP